MLYLTSNLLLSVSIDWEPVRIIFIWPGVKVNSWNTLKDINFYWKDVLHLILKINWSTCIWSSLFRFDFVFADIPEGLHVYIIITVQWKKRPPCLWSFYFFPVLVRFKKDWFFFPLNLCISDYYILCC